MIATRLHSGAWQFSELVRGYLVTRTYYGVSRRYAVRQFRAEVAEIQAAP